MRVLIPMAGEGQRFKDAGYELSKPAIPTYDSRTGKKLPMVVCATLDLPDVKQDGANVIYVERDFHRVNGTEGIIKEQFPNATFITVEELTEGQACTCLVAEEYIDNEEDLLIAGCDNGMEFNKEKFDLLKDKVDMIVFTYRRNEAVLANPNAYGWMITDHESDNITGISIKKAISSTPMEDHAVVATFWFRHGKIFVQAAKKMIEENDRVNGEFYVDQVVKHVMGLGHTAKVFEIDRYIGWGTPGDYELYQKTFEYWKGFCEREKILFG